MCQDKHATAQVLPQTAAMADSLDVLKLRTGSLDENCYVVSNPKTNEGIIIDPGDSADYVIQNISDRQITPVAIMATHGHYDHIMAAFELKLAYGIPFCMHKADEFFLQRFRKTVRHFEGYDPGPAAPVDVYLKNNSDIKIIDIDIRIIHTPGHTPGSVCMHFFNNHALFSGDLLFEGRIYGEVSHSYSDKQEILRSIAMIKKLPDNTTVYPGHGNPFLLSTEKRADG